MRPGKPPSVLIADDNWDAADTLAALLELRGYAVRVAYHGPAAVAAARADPPDCAILDIGMPGLNGLDVARQLRADPSTRAAKLIALTGYSANEIGSRALAAGFDHHLVKGRADPEEVLKMLEEIKGLATETEGLLQEAKAEFREAQAEIRETRQEVREVKEELKEVKEELKDVKEELKESGRPPTERGGPAGASGRGRCVARQSRAATTADGTRTTEKGRAPDGDAAPKVHSRPRAQSFPWPDQIDRERDRVRAELVRKTVLNWGPAVGTTVSAPWGIYESFRRLTPIPPVPTSRPSAPARTPTRSGRRRSTGALRQVGSSASPRSPTPTLTGLGLRDRGAGGTRVPLPRGRHADAVVTFRPGNRLLTQPV